MPLGSLFKSSDDKLFEQLFQLKQTGKQLERQAKKAQQEEAKEKAKVTAALKKNQRDFAQLYAENAIRKKNEALNYMRLASRMDAVASRIKSAQNMKQMTKDMTKVNSALGSAMQSMNLEKIQGVMDNFERSVEKLDLNTAVMENSMSGAMATGAPTNQIEDLIKQVAAENELEYISQAEAAPIGSTSLSAQQTQVINQQEADLDRRLAGLRN